MEQMLPILQYDNGKEAIAPDFEHLPLALPRAGCMAFLSERRIQNFVSSMGGRKLGEFISLTKRFPVYAVSMEGEDVALIQAPVGAPAAVMMEERLFAYGVEKLEAVGCCGVLTHVKENVFMIVQKAIRDEGTSYHYAPPAADIALDEEGIQAAKEALESLQIPYSLETTWTSDAFFRETKEKILRYRNQGVSAVDMECAALAACARFRKRVFGQILFTADTLAKEDAYDTRSWGKKSRDAALGAGMLAARCMISK
jgi:uridine phosphorylase